MTKDNFKKRRAFVSGVKGEKLLAEEAELFKKYKPLGLILFARNCISAQQIIDLIADFRDAVNLPQAPIFIDQEGGRVQRLKPPYFPKLPSCADYGKIYNIDQQAGLRISYLAGLILGNMLRDVTINVDCAPVLDLSFENTSDVIGNRAFSYNPEAITKLAKSYIEGISYFDVHTIIKHIPGHGRSKVDSHYDLPIIDESLEVLNKSDFVPFKNLNDAPMAMSSHLLYQHIDDKNPATLSKKVIENIIRDNIGFEGILLSDDISMQALSGDIKSRTIKAFQAGCDIVLHCNGVMNEMQMVAENSPFIVGSLLNKVDLLFNNQQNDVIREYNMADIYSEFEKIYFEHLNIKWSFE